MKLVAVSGGVDSMLLLDMMKYDGIEVAHVNYNYRDDSLQDEVLVRDTCCRLGIKCHVLSVARYKGSGFEAWARRVRYDFFKTIGYTTLYTAHNASDQAETVIMNHRRGCGLYGLGGMRESGKHKRPLLSYTKGEIYFMAKDRGITWREDSTNTDTNFTRNAIRARLTEGRCRLLSEYACLARDRHSVNIHKANAIYGSPVENPDGSVCFASPRDDAPGLWVDMFHMYVKDRLHFTSRHADLLLSRSPGTRVVGLGSGYHVKKKKRQYTLFRIL